MHAPPLQGVPGTSERLLGGRQRSRHVMGRHMALGTWQPLHQTAMGLQTALYRLPMQPAAGGVAEPLQPVNHASGHLLVQPGTLVAGEGQPTLSGHGVKAGHGHVFGCWVQRECGW